MFWTTKQIKVLKQDYQNNIDIKNIAIKLKRTRTSIKTKARLLGIKHASHNKRKTPDQYNRELEQICPTIICLENYINCSTPILHKCLICKTKYKVSPTSKLQGHTCKYCKNSTSSGITYLVYFPKLNLYKIGITSKTTAQRLRYIGSDYELILERHFSTLYEAEQLEIKWLFNINHLKIDTKKLVSGNTETFRT